VANRRGKITQSAHVPVDAPGSEVCRSSFRGERPILFYKSPSPTFLPFSITLTTLQELLPSASPSALMVAVTQWKASTRCYRTFPSRGPPSYPSSQLLCLPPHLLLFRLRSITRIHVTSSPILSNCSLLVMCRILILFFVFATAISALGPGEVGIASEDGPLSVIPHPVPTPASPGPADKGDGSYKCGKYHGSCAKGSCCSFSGMSSSLSFRPHLRSDALAQDSVATLRHIA
jgi:hypothetical protein